MTRPCPACSQPLPVEASEIRRLVEEYEERCMRYDAVVDRNEESEAYILARELRKLYAYRLADAIVKALNVGGTPPREQTTEAAARPQGVTGGEALQLCKCEKNPAQPPHGCPYASDVNDDHSEDYCTCCDDCAHECAMEI